MKHTNRIVRFASFILAGLIGILGFGGCSLPTKPKPVITSAAVENNCSIRINYIDHVKDLSSYQVFLERSVNNGSPNIIKFAQPHGERPSSFLDENLPGGAYWYVVGHLQDNGNAYSGRTETIVLDAAKCGTKPLVDRPFAPIIVEAKVGGIPACSALITVKSFPKRTQGIRVYRSDSDADYHKIGDYSFVDWFHTQDDNFFIQTSTYIDSTHEGKYRYKISAYNDNYESFSNTSEEVVITEKNCATAQQVVPTVLSLTLIPATPLPIPRPLACTWEAASNTSLRNGPDASLYSELTTMAAGSKLPIVGQSSDGMYWVVELTPGTIGYVPKAPEYSRTSGECGDRPTLPDPTLVPSATPSPTATLLPPFTATPVQPAVKPSATLPFILKVTSLPKVSPTAVRVILMPQCWDGIDNDHDGSIDTRDSGCTSRDDKIEN